MGFHCIQAKRTTSDLETVLLTVMDAYSGTEWVLAAGPARGVYLVSLDAAYVATPTMVEDLLIAITRARST